MPPNLLARILFHALMYAVPVAFMFGLAGGKAAESEVYARMIDRLPPTCQERMGRFDLSKL